MMNSSNDELYRPQPVTEKSLMESVAGFINEVPAFNQPNLPTDPKVYVLWARFEVADINDIKLLPERVEINGEINFSAVYKMPEI